ncbi:hypothetical protein NF716_07450 [Lactococcus formosensis]|uniref:hypothetical protein n=1 Tax=Lactococcus formosensis TaxID=1281486 RepID=UPI0024352290|nr:hypothetical protein [Lactococcus formosensis]MDG6156184.1 hypothetical protein [Lactococcus formosensis]
MKKIISLGLILLGILADQLLKGWTVANIPLGGEKEFIPGILSRFCCKVLNLLSNKVE